MLGYLFGAVFVSWLVSIYYIWKEKEITNEKFCKILTVSILTGPFDDNEIYSFPAIINPSLRADKTNLSERSNNCLPL